MRLRIANRTPPRRSDRIIEWAAREFSPRYAQQVAMGLIDVAAGNRDGNRFELTVLTKLFPEWEIECAS